MKRIFLHLILMLSFSFGYAQNMEEILTEKVTQLRGAYKKTDLQQFANDFERIALSDKQNWLANYYTAFCLIRLADEVEGKEIDAFCDKAEMYLKIAENLPSDKSEIYALYAYLYSAKVKANPMFRGSSMGKLSKEYSNKSIKENPDNPRPYLIRAIGIFYTPKIFGGGEEKARPILDQALERFKNFKAERPNYPSWGEGMASYLENQYKK
ncbi:MAG: hypothetical protein Q3983_05565 [Capnocytophaga sp.]|nr:hypothetical protein [Capnocytophaga sp.]